MININELNREKLCKLFDHTYLKAYAQQKDFERLCDEARQYGFMMVAINSAPVALCKRLLSGSDVHVGAAIAFPLGQTSIRSKCAETIEAINNGADEIDYVINIGKAKDHDYDYIKEEMEAIVKICKERSVLSKVIFENCYLDKEEIRQLALIAKEVKPDFIKTSTGFGTSGAAVEDVRLMKETVGDEVKVKAAGGIRDWPTCKAMLEAGTERIGTSSSIKILEEFLQEKKI
ncbi:MAG: deoxyribose-phosphate aldolase [Erysipelotrichaceae bacterium]|nr:deoxyribose-phosphate aldolase [Erysipelotrichaceae bacterium]